MTPDEHMREMMPHLTYHLRNTVTIGTGPVTYLREAAAAHIDAQDAKIKALVGLMPEVLASLDATGCNVSLAKDLRAALAAAKETTA